MTLEEYETYVEWHEGKCAICKSEPTGEGQQGERLHVDHDHKTGLVRGLLCGNCNRAIGLLKDDSDLLRAAAGYLEFHDEWNREVYPHVYER